VVRRRMWNETGQTGQRLVGILRQERYVLALYCGVTAPERAWREPGLGHDGLFVVA
jgi:hypothetical protein